MLILFGMDGFNRSVTTAYNCVDNSISAISCDYATKEELNSLRSVLDDIQYKSGVITSIPQEEPTITFFTLVKRLCRQDLKNHF